MYFISPDCLSKSMKFRQFSENIFFKIISSQNLSTNLDDFWCSWKLMISAFTSTWNHSIRLIHRWVIAANVSPEKKYRFYLWKVSLKKQNYILYRKSYSKVDEFWWLSLFFFIFTDTPKCVKCPTSRIDCEANFLSILENFFPKWLYFRWKVHCCHL